MKLNKPRRQRAEGQNPINRHSTQSERTLTYPLSFKHGTLCTLRARFVREERRDREILLVLHCQRHVCRSVALSWTFWIQNRNLCVLALHFAPGPSPLFPKRVAEALRPHCRHPNSLHTWAYQKCQYWNQTVKTSQETQGEREPLSILKASSGSASKRGA